MTYKEITESNREMLIPKDIAEVLGVNPYSITLQAKEDPSTLGFPVIRIGTRTLIPRRGFINFLNGFGREYDSLNIVSTQSSKEQSENH